MPAACLDNDDTAQDPPEQSRVGAADQRLGASQLITNPELQQLLEIVASQMRLPEYALRRSLQTILAMYSSAAQGGQPIIRYPSTRTEQHINLPGMTT